jgi:hypothetical protein
MVSPAQSNAPRDAWLMQNYRFTGPPPPGSVRPTDPILSELWRIQDAVTRLMLQARLDWDYGTAIAAASQASANAQLIEGITEQREAVAAARAWAEAARSSAPQAPPQPLYMIAFRDHTMETAIRYWTDGPMLHYLTRGGAHVQVRLDLVDRDLSVRLNRGANLDFHLPE